MLVVATIPKGDDLVQVQLLELSFWVQIHGLPSGLMSESVEKQLGNFFDTYVMYDPNNNTSIWRECV